MTERGQFRRSFDILVSATILLFLGLAALGVIGYLDSRSHSLQARSQSLQAKRQAAKNRAALEYICSTTAVLDRLVVDARDQIQANIDNGVYSRLLKQGVIKPENVRNAYKTLDRYQEAHLKLQERGPCLKVAKK